MFNPPFAAKAAARILAGTASSLRCFFTVIAFAFCSPGILETASAAEFEVTGTGNSAVGFGTSVDLLDSTAIGGASGGVGSVYLFRNLDAISESFTQSAKLTASDGATSDKFGSAVSLSSSDVLVGAFQKNNFTGAAYFFHGVESLSGTVTQNVKLTPSSPHSYDHFGFAVSLSGSTALVGAPAHYHPSPGAAYFYQDLSTASGTVTQNVKLTASDAIAKDMIGTSVSLAASTALVGAPGHLGVPGKAYLFRNLQNATGTVTEDLKLTASDGVNGDNFGYSNSLSGTSALVGADLDDNTKSNSGSAYLFRDLDNSTGTINQQAKLRPLIEGTNARFGNSVSLSGSAALVRAVGTGNAYLFLNLDTATGEITEDVKLSISTQLATSSPSVSLDGDNFVLGAPQDSKVSTGSVSSLTTLDEGTFPRRLRASALFPNAIGSLAWRRTTIT